MTPTTSTFDLRRLSLPVFGCNRLGDAPIQICGSAFAIGGGFFLTAAHVLHTVLEYPVATLGFVPTGAEGGPTTSMNAPILEHEVLDSVDLAVLRCAGAPWDALKWGSDDVPLLTQVVTGGYPYALQSQHLTMFVRAYRGHVVAVRPAFHLTEQPTCYELSLPAPRGLSGAPVLMEDTVPHVVGYVIGNHRSEMRVQSDREVDNSSGTEIIVEHYEYLTHGIAITVGAILETASTLLGSTFREHLRRLDLLA